MGLLGQNRFRRVDECIVAIATDFNGGLDQIGACGQEGVSHPGDGAESQDERDQAPASSQYRKIVGESLQRRAGNRMIESHPETDEERGGNRRATQEPSHGTGSIPKTGRKYARPAKNRHPRSVVERQFYALPVRPGFAKIGRF